MFTFSSQLRGEALPCASKILASDSSTQSITLTYIGKENIHEGWYA